MLTGWTAERVQEYFVWASRVVKGLRGTNAALEEKLLQLFLERGVELQWFHKPNYVLFFSFCIWSSWDVLYPKGTVQPNLFWLSSLCGAQEEMLMKISSTFSFVFHLIKSYRTTSGWVNDDWILIFESALVLRFFNYIFFLIIQM